MGRPGVYRDQVQTLIDDAYQKGRESATRDLVESGVITPEIANDWLEKNFSIDKELTNGTTN